MMKLFLQAVDVWLFRDGRPFDALSDHRAESMFPPYPTVVQGAIRSRHLVVMGVDPRDGPAVKAAVGGESDLRGVRLRGPFVARREGGAVVRYLPQPADAVTLDKDRHLIRPAARPRLPEPGVWTSAPTTMLLGLDDEPSKGLTGLWLREDDLRRYLKQEQVAGTPGQKLFTRENRFGIGVDTGRRTAMVGALYEVEFIRPARDVGLLVEVEGYEGWPAEGLLQLGGEGRAARFQQVPSPPWPAPPDPLPERFKLYFATPTFFQDGWVPREWSEFFDGSVDLVAAAVGRYESVGGFDFANQRHKPSRRYVPAGSVYYFQCHGRARLASHLVQNAVTQYGAEMGFGQILVGEW